MEIARLYYGRLFLFVTAVLSLAAVCGRQLGPRATLALLASGVVILGLPHGALDPLVARKFRVAHHTHNKPAFYAIYLLLGLSYLFLWTKCPTLGLVGFLAIAAFHFGSDWDPLGSAVTRLAYGLTVVTLPALLHPAAVGSVYHALGASHVELLVKIAGNVGIVSAIVACLAAMERFNRHRRDLVELAGILIGAVLLQPLLFFTCYFSLLHSPRHLLQTAEAVGIESLKHLYFRTAPIVLVTTALGVSIYFLLPASYWGDRILTIVFIGLAALTVPHMFLNGLASRTQPGPFARPRPTLG